MGVSKVVRKGWGGVSDTLYDILTQDIFIKMEKMQGSISPSILSSRFEGDGA